MSKSEAKRIQTSFLNRAEKKALGWLVTKVPDRMTSDCLTWIGVAGAVICAVGFALGNINIQWLWLSSGGLVINWLGDSLDGTLARYRQTQRPTYGFYIDHSLDAITICIMCIGAGLSPLFYFSIAMLALAGYLVLSIFTYIGTLLKDEFRLTYGGFGPTEFRLAIIILNTLAIFTPFLRWGVVICGYFFNVFDFLGVAIIVTLFTLIFWQFGSDLKYFAKKDPLPPYHPKK